MPLSAAGTIVCGPMVRRVDAAGASVFVVLKAARDVQLVLHDSTDPASPVVGAPSPFTPARKFGANFYAYVATVQPTGGLQRGKVYGYDVQLRDPGTGAVQNLSALGLLGGAVPLGYDVGWLPGFVLPPNDVTQVRILHASCRLAGAEGPDVIQMLDSIVAGSRTDPTQRPQQLFLTGDQIYADDVEPSLLWMAQTVGMQLLGWPDAELIPGFDPTLYSPPGPTDRKITDYSLWPGRRMFPLDKMGGLSTTEGSCHLMGLAEFVGMYCLVWSPELWTWSGSEVILPDPVQLWPGAAWLSDSNKHVREEAVKKLQEHQPAVKDLAKHSPQVRRALANIATFMQFDDHEVTDDWNIHRQWCERVYRSEMGRRVVQNALSGYVVFQAWGNNPTRFDPGTPGDTMLKEIGRWTGDKPGADRIQVAIGLPARSAPTQTSPFRWDYEVRSGAYDVIVLDSRTHRGFDDAATDPKGTAGAALLGPGEIQTQLLDRLAQRQAEGRTVEFTIVIAPAPVIGHPLLESILQPTVTKVWNVRKYIAEHSWGLIEGPRGGEEEWDTEAWSFNPGTFQELLRALSRFQRVVLLSGDVHYGFSAKVQYWNDRQGEQIRAGIVQLTASGLRNEVFKTRLLGRGRLDKVPLVHIEGVTSPWPGAMAGWVSDGPHIIGSSVEIGGQFPESISESPHVRELPMASNEEFAKEPDWRFRYFFVQDARPKAQRQTFPAGWPTIPAAPASDQTKELFAIGQEHVRRMEHDEMRVVVGHNNFGDVRFVGQQSDRLVQHALWYRPNPEVRDVSSFPIWPSTVHTIPLNPPSDAITKPGAHQR